MTNLAIGDCQVDTAQQQLAEVGFLGGCGFPTEMCGLVERGAVGIAGRGADGEACEVVWAGAPTG